MKTPAIVAIIVQLAILAAGLRWIDSQFFEPIAMPDHGYKPQIVATATPVTPYVPFDAYDVSDEGYTSYADWMNERPNNKMGVAIADPLPVAIEEIYNAPPPLPALQEYGMIQAPHGYSFHSFGGEPWPWIRSASVPEPATWLMFGTGIIVCIALRYRRRHVK